MYGVREFSCDFILRQNLASCGRSPDRIKNKSRLLERLVTKIIGLLVKARRQFVPPNETDELRTINYIV